MVSSWGLCVVNTVAEFDGKATSWRRTIWTLTMIRFNGLKNWPWRGGDENKLSALRFTLAIATKRILAKPRSILGVLPCSIRKIWRLGARTKNEHTMDDFSTLTTREPWLLEKSFYFYYFHLASRDRIDATRSSRIAAWDQVNDDFQKTITKERRLPKESQMFLYERWLYVGTSE
jgi:hypothetical protein